MDIDTWNIDDRGARFAAVISAARTKPFVWGEFDCATFAADCVRAISGKDILGGLSWSTEQGAAKIVARAGGMRAIMSERMGQELPPSHATTGDVVLITDPLTGLDAFAIHAGDHVLAVSANAGLVSMPVTAALCCWRTTCRV